jgi:hypothetical protein
MSNSRRATSGVTDRSVRVDGSVKDKGKPAHEQRAQPRLVEGVTVPGWKQALGALALHFPYRLDSYLNYPESTGIHTLQGRSSSLRGVPMKIWSMVFSSAPAMSWRAGRMRRRRWS